MFPDWLVNRIRKNFKEFACQSLAHKADPARPHSPANSHLGASSTRTIRTAVDHLGSVATSTTAFGRLELAAEGRYRRQIVRVRTIDELPLSLHGD